ncbi:MAG: hypothetical protein GXP48_02575 [Acidobacteria bacterium]|nr:hypothetical protein [Acidobacteriota bacterium]
MTDWTKAEQEIPTGPDHRVRIFILLRLTLVIATSYLVLAQHNFARPSSTLTALILAGILSNALIPPVSKRITDSSTMLGAIIVADTAWITVTLIATGNFHAEFFYLYFFVLFIAAIGENLVLIILGALLACSAYFLALIATGRGGQLMTPAVLIRMPFMLSVAVFYGYLADRVRREQNRAQAEAIIISELNANRKSLAEANALLEAEIEERKKMESELHKISEMKSAFVSAASHELRTPLTAIRNAVDLLQTTRNNEAAFDKFMAIAQRNVERLTFIVNDLLDLSKIEAGKLTFAFTRVELEPFLGHTVESFEPLAQAAHLELSLDVEGILPPVWADPQRIEQVVSNLVGNAIKFTPAGGTVLVGASSKNGWVEVSVSDSGCGLAVEELEKIFEPFYQVGDALTGRARGTGLGLTISRNLVRAHGSDITVTSRKGSGSRFSFMLPVDGPGAREIVDLETRIREFRAYPFFALLVVQAPPGRPPTLEHREKWAGRLLDGANEVLPRSSDVLIPQPAHERLIIVLLGTQASGAEIVRQRLQTHFEARRAEGDMDDAVPHVSGIAAYPEDGDTGAQLIRAAIAAGRRKNRDQEDPSR